MENSNDIYVLVESGEYEYTDYSFIKIKESDKCKFKDFAKDTRDFGWNEEITIKAWVKELCLEEDEYFDMMSVIRIDEYQEKLKEILARMKYMGDRHYLKGKEEYFIRLLNYEFKQVETTLMY